MGVRGFAAPNLAIKDVRNGSAPVWSPAQGRLGDASYACHVMLVGGVQRVSAKSGRSPTTAFKEVLAP